MRENLIYHKKKLYYLLSNMPEKDILDSEQALLALLQEDIELQAELGYDQYMRGNHK